MVAIYPGLLSSKVPSTWDLMNIFSPGLLVTDKSSSCNWDVRDFPDWPAWIVDVAVQHFSPPVNYLG